jgi:putative transposase
MKVCELAGRSPRQHTTTTLPDPAAARPAALIAREFTAHRPHQLWVCDLTYIRTWVDFAYLALVVDVFSRRIVGCLHSEIGMRPPVEAEDDYRQHRPLATAGS